MASSSSSVNIRAKYDVFLSFRGEDTRHNFTSHLYSALIKENIAAFIDDDGLQRGDEISPALLKVIEDSVISVIIFSEEYAASRWCLDELARIIECKNTKGQIVVPVFYHIEPADVREQTGSFEKAFVEHEERFKETPERVQIWRAALTQAADLSGYHVMKNRPEFKIVDEVVEDLLKKLTGKSSLTGDYDGLVGINSRVDQVKTMLSKSEVIGIWGMGGIGKTTIAEILFNQISRDFDGCCFIKNVREELEKYGGQLVSLQQKIISRILGENHVFDTPTTIPQFIIRQRLQRKKVLIALDDVNDSLHLECLIGGLKPLSQESKIIITTRDKQVLLAYGVNNIYEVEELNDDEALLLFCKQAFKQNNPIEDLQKLSYMIIKYAKGNPLVIRVIGCTLYGKSKEVWDSFNDNFDVIGGTQISNMLNIDFDALEDIEKKIFLDIACFLKGEDIDVAKKVLKACYPSSPIILDQLINKSLIKISIYQLQMDDLLQDMGRRIVYQESENNPGKRSRLWHYNDVYDVLQNNKGTEAVETILVDMSRSKEMHLSSNAFVNMTNLRLLKLYWPHEHFGYQANINRVFLPQGIEYLSNKLIYLRWDGYPLEALPSNFSREKLVALELPYSNIEPPLEETKDSSLLGCLRHTFVERYKNLLKVPSSNQYFCNLHLLNMEGCRNLKRFPREIHFGSSITIDLSDCINLTEFPQISGNVKRLYLERTAIKEVPITIASLCELEDLVMCDCRNLKNLPASIKQLPNLHFLDISCCERLSHLPELPRGIDMEAYNCASLESISDLSFLFSRTSRPQRVNFANCFKLYLPKILEKDLHRIDHSASICYPGNEIPEWFRFQTTGSSMAIQLPSEWKKRKHLGFAICVVVEFPERYTVQKDFEVRCCFNTKRTGDEIEVHVWSERGRDGDFHALHAAYFIESDHVFMGFGSEVWDSQDDTHMYEMKKTSNNEVLFKFYAHGVVVKKCGIHIFFAEESYETDEEEVVLLPSNSLVGQSSTSQVIKYDVFLSFRDEDTQDNFTSHLHAALSRAKIETFTNDELVRGDEFSSSLLLSAIEESMISIIIFSEGYASSEFCLDELVKILECQKKCNQVVILVFYHVNPSVVQNLRDNFGNEQSSAMLKRLGTALREAAFLFDFDSSNYRFEAVLVEDIVNRVVKILNDRYPRDNKDLVGVRSSIEKIESLLKIRSKDVCIAGICGGSGIGKTTIAMAVFEKIKSQFDNSFFALNVGEELENDGLTGLRHNLLSTILTDQHSNKGFNFLKQRLGLKRFLLVFDGVTSLEQIKFLVGDLNNFSLGSRIIITTKDRQVLKTCGVNADNMYMVKALSDHDALQLFSWFAFQQNRPLHVYSELSNRIVQYAEGVPLVLRVLGSFLSGRKEKVWKSAIGKLESMPCNDIQGVLKLCYDGLDDDEKNIFLDIACFLKGEDKDFVIKFLDASGFYAEIGISDLIDKCFITLSNKKIMMHDLLKKMAWEIVEESFEDLGRCLRHPDKVCCVLRDKDNMGNRAIEGIWLDMSKTTDIELHSHAFTGMQNLRFLKLFNSHCEKNSINKVHVSCLENVFTELRYLSWHGYPLESLQSNCLSEYLVAIDMPYCKIEQLWIGDLIHLKYINLSHSKNLFKISDLRHAPNLEILNLEDCISLRVICPSIQSLHNLVILNLRHCKSLSTFPAVPCNIEKLYLEEATIEELPIKNLCRLVMLDLKNCSRLKSLPSSVYKLKSLEHLNISGCLNLEELPGRLGNLEALKVLKAERLAKRVPSSFVYLRILTELDLTACDIMELPSRLDQLSSLESLLLGRNTFQSIPTSIMDLSKLRYLDLGYCERLESLPSLPYHLQYLDAYNCTSLEAFPPSLRNVRSNFINCFKLKESLLLAFLADFLKKIQDTVMELGPRLSAYICFPGSEIPWWFTFQSTGSSITLELHPSLLNRRFVSFAVCAIVGIQKYHEEGQGLVVGCEFKLGTRDGSMVVYYGIGPSYVDSDHIFLGYDLHLCSFDLGDSPYSDNLEVSINFYVQDSNAKHVDCCEVKKSGIQLVYYGEKQVVIDDKEEEEPPRKKLKQALL